MGKKIRAVVRFISLVTLATLVFLVGFMERINFWGKKTLANDEHNAVTSLFMPNHALADSPSGPGPASPGSGPGPGPGGPSGPGGSSGGAGSPA